MLSSNIIDLSGLISTTYPYRGIYSLEIECEYNFEHNNFVATFNENRRMAIGCRNLLTILNIPSIELENNKYDETELEFEDEVQSLCWDELGNNIVVGDNSGTLHLVTSEGSLVFSHRVLPKTVKSNFLTLCFLNDTSSSTNNQSILVAALDNGLIFGICQFPINSINQMASMAPKAISSMVQNLNTIKCQLPFHHLQKIIICCSAAPKDGGKHSIIAVFIDAQQKLHIADLGTTSSIQYHQKSCITPRSSNDMPCIDVVSISKDNSSQKKILALYSDSTVTIMNIETGIQIASTQLSVPCLKILSYNAGALLTSDNVGSGSPWFCSFTVLTEINGPVATYTLFGVGQLQRAINIGVEHSSHSNSNSIKRSPIGEKSSSKVSQMIIHSRASTGGKIDIFEIDNSICELMEGLFQGIQLETIHIETLSTSDISILCGYLLRDSHSESVLNDILGGMATLSSSCQEVMTLLQAFLAIEYPSSGFLLRCLDAAEVAVNEVTTIYGGNRHTYLTLLSDYRRCLQTAQKLTWKPEHTPRTKTLTSSIDSKEKEDQDNSSDEMKIQIYNDIEENNRLRLLQLIRGDHGIEEAWSACVATNHLHDASLIMNKHMIGMIPKQLSKSFRTLPLDVLVDDLLQWIHDGILMKCKTLLSTSPNTTLVSQVNTIAHELCKRARALENKDNHPFNAVTLSELALLFASSIPKQHHRTSSTDRYEESLQLHTSLRLQAALRKSMLLSYSLFEVTSLGLQGILLKRLKDVNEKTLEYEVNKVFRPIMLEFGGDVSVDSLLLHWVEDIVRTHVIHTTNDNDVDVVNDDDANHGSRQQKVEVAHTLNESQVVEAEGGTCSLSRLVIAVSGIIDVSKRAKAVLLLLQVPAVNIHNNSNNKNIESHGLVTRSDQQHRVNNSSSASTKLMSMALDACCLLDSDTKDALTEAIRLHKLRLLASNYNVIGLDVRDVRQVRSVVSLIASSSTRPTALKDAIEFATSWTATAIDLNAVYSRAIIQRVMEEQIGTAGGAGAGAGEEGDVDDEQSSNKSAAIIECMTIIPVDRLPIVVDEICTFLVNNLEEICRSTGSAHQREGKEETKQYGSLTSITDNKEAMICCRGAISIISWFLESKRIGVDSNKREKQQQQYADIYEDCTAWITMDLLATLKKINALQTDHHIYLSPSDLRNHSICCQVAAQLGKARAEEILAKPDTIMNEGDVLTSSLVKACSRLSVSLLYVVQTIIKRLLEGGATALAIMVARVAAKENIAAAMSGSIFITSQSLETNIDSQYLVDVTMTLCSSMGKQTVPAKGKGTVPVNRPSGLSSQLQSIPLETPFQLSTEILRAVAVTCPPIQLSRTLDLLSTSEVVLAVLDRSEAVEGGGTGRIQSASAVTGAAEKRGRNVESGAGSAQRIPVESSEQEFKISGNYFIRDGVLMQHANVSTPLLRYVTKELHRRSVNKVIFSDDSTSSSSSAKSLLEANAMSVSVLDVEELVTHLQRSENHLLAIRVLLGCWNSGGTKIQSLRSSLLALSRKILSYRNIDVSLAVACLSAVNYESMVRELKASVPSIQSDFSRLCTVATIGEQLAHMWNQDDLLTVFQSLQTNAKWWHTLTSYGIQIDPRAFQSSIQSQREGCVRAIIPELLEKSELNLALTIEYCQQFDIEPVVAIVTYVEKLLLQRPTNPSDTLWTSLVRRAAARVDGEAVGKCLRSLLTKLHPLDYEKIRFVCLWLIQLLVEEDMGSDSPNTLLITDKQRISGENDLSIDLDETFQRPSSGVNISYDSSIVVELETYRRYSDITAFLSNLAFPEEAISRIIVDSSNGDSPTVSLYEGLLPAYRTRIPLWALLEDPWSVLEPIMVVSPKMSLKLSPLCDALQLERDEFLGRRAMAAYTRATTLTTATINRINDCDSKASSEKEMFVGTPFDLLDESIRDISSYRQKIEVWRWLFEKERGRDDAMALRALEKALDCVSYTSTSDDSLRVELLQELVKVRCQETLRTLFLFLRSSRSNKDHRGEINTEISPPPAPPSFLMSSASDPLMLLKKLLEWFRDVLWNVQLEQLHSSDGSSGLSIHDILQHPLCTVVCSYLDKLAVALEEISKQGTLTSTSTDMNNATTTTVSTDSNQNGGIAVSVSGLEKLRHGYLGQLLSDSDLSSNASSSLPAAGSGSGIPASNKAGFTMSSSSSSRAMSTLKSNVNTGAGGGWGSLFGADKSSSVLYPSPAEIRRREDLYRGFSIATLIYCCQDKKLRLLYESQMEAVARGKGAAKSMRRLTSRSRLRAAIALSFLARQTLLSHGVSQDSISEELTTTATTTTTVLRNESDGVSLKKILSYLLCLSELQEIRLPCSEESLEAALGITSENESVCGSGSTSSVSDQARGMSTSGSGSGSDALSLVRTWLHDEGRVSEVSELCRDVLLAVNCMEVIQWTMLLDHMDSNGHSRALLSTLSVLCRSALLSALIRGNTACYVLRLLFSTTTDIIERAEQIFELLRSAVMSSDLSSGVSAVGGKDYDMLSVSEFGEDNHDAIDYPSRMASISGLAPAQSHRGGRPESVASYRPTQRITQKDRETDSDSSSTTYHSSRRILLIPKCGSFSWLASHSYHRGGGETSSRHWVESPEDMILTALQVTYIWNIIVESVGIDALLATAAAAGGAGGGDLLRVEIRNLWENSLNLLRVASRESNGLGQNNSLHFEWGGTVDAVVTYQLERCSFSLSTSGAVLGVGVGLGVGLDEEYENPIILKKLFEAISPMKIMTIVTVEDDINILPYWRALLAMSGFTLLSIHIAIGLDEIFLQPSTNDSQPGSGSNSNRNSSSWDMEFKEYLFYLLLEQVGLHWDSDISQRKASKALLLWAYSSDKAFEYIQRIQLKLPDTIQQSLQLAVDVFQIQKF